MEIVKASLPITEIMSIGKAFQESGMFPDIKTVAQAVVKIQAGQEIGIPPFAAMTGIHIIQGRPTIGAGLIASRIKGSGKYDFTVKEMSDKNCVIEFYQGKKHIGTSSFNLDDARRAGTKNLDKFPRNMLFARAISNGVKWYCPDVFSGPVYTPEDFNEESKPDVLPTLQVLPTPDDYENTNEFEDTLPTIVEGISDVERDDLLSLLDTSTYEGTQRDKLFSRINSISNRDEYDKAKANLLANQSGIEGAVNPGQREIGRHVRNISKQPV